MGIVQNFGMSPASWTDGPKRAVSKRAVESLRPGQPENNIELFDLPLDRKRPDSDLVLRLQIKRFMHKQHVWLSTV